MIRHNLLPSAMVDMLGSLEDVYEDPRVDINRIFKFPDGSVYFDSENLAKMVREGIGQSLGVLRVFRPIAPFGGQSMLYHLFYPKEHERKFGELGFLPGPGGGQPITALENALEYLSVDFYLKRIPNKEDASQFAEYIREFFAKFVDWKEIHPVLPVSPLVIQGKRARFYIDVRGAGHISLL